jgi:hypothetical protein
LLFCGSEPARGGDLKANQFPSNSCDPTVGAAEGCDLLTLLFCRSEPARDGDLKANQFPSNSCDPTVGAAEGCDLLIFCFSVGVSLLAMAT